MAADFNGDGSFDGYDMQYLSGGGYNGDGGCDGCIKYGCMLPLIGTIAAGAFFAILLEIIKAVNGY